MQINRNNYEGYFLDFLEGRLSAPEAEQLMAFLKINPDLEDQLLLFDNTIKGPVNEVKFNKNLLLKSLEDFESVTDANFDEFCIAWYENELSPSARKALSEYLLFNPGKKKDFLLYEKLHLQADISIHFPFKSKLKKYTINPLRRIVYYAASAAAIILMFIYLYPINKTVNQVSENHSGPKSSKTVQAVKIDSKETQPVNTSAPGVLDGTVIATGNNIALQMTKDSSEENGSRFSSAIAGLIILNPISTNGLHSDLVQNPKEFSFLSKQDVHPAMDPVYPNLMELAQLNLNKFFDSNSGTDDSSDDNTFWKLAKMGVSGINKLTGSNMKLNRTVNDQGKITAMVFESGALGFSRSVSK